MIEIAVGSIQAHKLHESVDKGILALRLERSLWARPDELGLLLRAFHLNLVHDLLTAAWLDGLTKKLTQLHEGRLRPVHLTCCIGFFFLLPDARFQRSHLIVESLVLRLTVCTFVFIELFLPLLDLFRRLLDIVVEILRFSSSLRLFRPVGQCLIDFLLQFDLILPSGLRMARLNIWFLGHASLVHRPLIWIPPSKTGLWSKRCGCNTL